MSDIKPTGRWRHRTERRWGREQLVLQLEERFLHAYCVGGIIDSEWRTRWRDARAADVTATTHAPAGCG